MPDMKRCRRPVLAGMIAWLACLAYAAEIQIGADKAAVLKELGQPTGQLTLRDKEILTYPDQQVEIQAGKVLRIEPVVSGKSSGSVPPSSPEINRLENEGISLFKLGQMEAGLDKVKQAVNLDPGSSARRLHYGSLLFARGGMLNQSGQKEAALAVFKDANQQLVQAIALSQGVSAGNTTAAQAHYLMGKIDEHVYGNSAGARAHYQAALAQCPEHTGAEQALKALEFVPGLASVALASVSNVPAVRQSVPLKFQGKNLLLSYKGESAATRVWEYVPEGQDIKNWNEMAAIYRYKQMILPEQIVQSMDDKVRSAGGNVLANARSSDGSPVIAFILSDAKGTESEINVWRFFQKGGVTIGHQYVRRYRSTGHAQQARQEANSSLREWIADISTRPFPDPEP